MASRNGFLMKNMMNWTGEFILIFHLFIFIARGQTKL